MGYGYCGWWGAGMAHGQDPFLGIGELSPELGLTLALNQARAFELAAQLKLVGWSVHRIGTRVLAVGSGVTIRVVPAGASAGIKQVKLHLRRSVPHQSIQLGNATLRLAGNTGRLVFWK